MLNLLVLFWIGAVSGFEFPGGALTNTKPKLSPPENFVAPTPRPLTITSAKEIPSLLSGAVALGVRLGSGIAVQGWKPSVSLNDFEEGRYSLSLGPVNLSDESTLESALNRGIKKPLILYEYEPSPYCRKVREILCYLDIPCEFRPTTSKSAFSDELFERTGRRTVPYLIDPNDKTNTAKDGMFESEDIIDYLLSTYGDGTTVNFAARGKVAEITGTLSTIARGLKGGQRNPDARPDNTQMIPLTLYGYEGSPFVKPVRETLCSLALPHVLIPCARGSNNRAEQMKLTGKQFQVPYLVDQNTGCDLFESSAIVDYLLQVYTTK